MKYRDLFENWGLTKIKLNVGFAEAEFNAQPEDEEAAWELYVELLTRITTQKLDPEDGDEKTALASVFSLFKITREILKRKGRKCQNFTKIAVIVLNQVVRPFTAKWHKISLAGGFEDVEKCNQFRSELSIIQEGLLHYTRLLASIAKVEDLTRIDEVE